MTLSGFLIEQYLTYNSIYLNCGVSRIIAIDYGLKRTGLAWTDPDQIIATGIGSFDTQQLKNKLKKLVDEADIEGILLGYPTRLDGSDTHSTSAVREFEKWLIKVFPKLYIKRWDERFTSKMAMDAMIAGGVKKKKRRDKHLINELSATILLQEYLREYN